jgi:hypothetical protein
MTAVEHSGLWSDEPTKDDLLSFDAVASTVVDAVPAWRARTAPERDGSMTKHTVSGPMNTHSHHFAGPLPSRGANTRHVVSSACKCHDPRDRPAPSPGPRPRLPPVTPKSAA